MITVNPTNPSSDDNVELVFIGSSGICAFNTSQTVDGSQFEFTVQGFACEFGVPLPVFQFSWPLGRLEVGEYTAVLNVDVPGVPAFTQTTTEAFTVSQGTLPFLHPSPVPVLSIPSLIILAGALAWIANKALNGEMTRRRER